MAEGPEADPRVSAWLMWATYALGAIGYFLGFERLASGAAAEAIRPVALLSVGIVGVVSMVRHSIFHRSDAARMGWDLGRRNNFQIEVGFANLAIGATAIAAVVLDWGTTSEAAVTLVYALYFAQVAGLVVIDCTEEGVDVGRLMAMLLQTVLLGGFAIAALQDAGAQPFGS